MTTTGQRELEPRRLGDLPTAASFESEFPCPADRFAALSFEARSRGTLPGPHAEARRRALTQALRLGHTAYALAKRARLHPTRAYQLKAEARTS